MTVSEKLKEERCPVLPTTRPAVAASECLIADGEIVRYALTANVVAEPNGLRTGIFIITDHRLLFSSKIRTEFHAAQILFRDGLNIGDFNVKLLNSFVAFANDKQTITVYATKRNCAAMIAEAEAAFADRDDITPFDYPPLPEPPAPASQKKAAAPAVKPEKIAKPEKPKKPSKSEQYIKICADCGDRLLYGAHKCPTCGSNRLIEVDRSDEAKIKYLREHPSSAGGQTVWKPPAQSKRETTADRIKANKAAGIACCPKCGSTFLSANKKGFGVGKAVIGAAAIGNPVGLVAGGLGANKVVVTCLSCGHKFKPGSK